MKIINIIILDKNGLKIREFNNIKKVSWITEKKIELIISDNKKITIFLNNLNLFIEELTN